MRVDMFKVIVERPRRTYISLGDNHHVRIKGDAEDLPKQESISKRYGIYWGERLNENLSPLKRFLISRVGQPWSEVWSEICKNLSPDSAVKKHVRDHAIQYVETSIRMIDGLPYELRHKYGIGWEWRPMTGSPNYTRLYQDPETGLLQRAPNDKSYRSKLREERRNKLRNACVDGSRNEKIDGIWYNVSTIEYVEKEWRSDYDKGLDKVTGLFPMKYVEVKKTKEVYTQLGKKYLKKFFKWQKTGIWEGKKKKRAKYLRKAL